jgi:hypothetical protein
MQKCELDKQTNKQERSNDSNNRSNNGNNNIKDNNNSKVSNYFSCYLRLKFSNGFMKISIFLLIVTVGDLSGS